MDSVDILAFALQFCVLQQDVGFISITTDSSDARQDSLIAWLDDYQPDSIFDEVSQQDLRLAIAPNAVIPRKLYARLQQVVHPANENHVMLLHQFHSSQYRIAILQRKARPLENPGKKTHGTGA